MVETIINIEKPRKLIKCTPIKTIIYISIILFSLLATSCSDSQETKQDLAKEEPISNDLSEKTPESKTAEDYDTPAEVIKEQSFWVDFENFGKVYFAVLAKGPSKVLELELRSSENDYNYIYKFPDNSYCINWALWQVLAVSFMDMNFDGLKDVTIIAEFMSGYGQTAAVPFPYAIIYFQEGDHFVTDDDLSIELADYMSNTSIEKVYQYIKARHENRESP